MQNLKINQKTFKAISVPTENTKLLIIQGSKGFLGCGYINLEAANKFNEAVAIVIGVANFDDMLEKEVVKVSEKAKTFGISVGMSGKEALLLLK